MSAEQSYGLWSLVIFNSLVFILFAWTLLRPVGWRDWRGLGALSAFVVALFVEMYGFPLTIFVLSGWLQSAFPAIDWFAHDAGHLPETLIGWRANPHLGPFHMASLAFLAGGFWLVWRGWRELHRAAAAGALATTGPYARLRHPQYAGLILVLTGYLIQWPTLATVALYPVLVWLYVGLARREERDSRRRFGADYDAYAACVPAFLPRRNRPCRTGGAGR